MHKLYYILLSHCRKKRSNIVSSIEKVSTVWEKEYKDARAHRKRWSKIEVGRKFNFTASKDRFLSIFSHSNTSNYSSQPSRAIRNQSRFFFSWTNHLQWEKSILNQTIIEPIQNTRISTKHEHFRKMWEQYHKRHQSRCFAWNTVKVAFKEHHEFGNISSKEEMFFRVIYA